MANKITIEDPDKTVTFTLDGAALTASSPEIVSFIKELEDLSSVCGSPGGLDIWQVENGLPVYDYYMKSKDQREFTEAVRIMDGDFGDATHTFNVPDEWSTKELDAYFKLRRSSTQMLYDLHISKIVAKWK